MKITRFLPLALFVAALALPLIGCKTARSDNARYDERAGTRGMENQAGTYGNGSGSVPNKNRP